MTNKLKFLIGLNVVLIGLLFFSFGNDRTAVQRDEEKKSFAVLDTVMVDKIELGELTFEKLEDGKWTINQQYEAASDRMETLLTLLNRVEVKRSVFASEEDSLKRILDDEGLTVNIFQNGESFNYVLSGNEEETYGMKDDQLVVLNIPGYFINLYGLLSEGVSAWRDRRVLQTTWRTLKRMKVEYPNEPANNFRIDFDNGFYSVEGLQSLDTANLFNYINQFQVFQIDEFVSSDKPVFDKDAKPFSTIKIEDIYSSRSNTLSVFPTDSLIYGFSEKDQEWVTIDPRSIQDILIRKEYFEKRN